MYIGTVQKTSYLKGSIDKTSHEMFSVVDNTLINHDVNGYYTTFFQYYYKFTALRSLDPNILYDPLLSIPKYDTVPAKETGGWYIHVVYSVSIFSIFLTSHVKAN